jgi:hypothetical protein
MTQTLVESVTSQAIPLDRADECFRRVGPTKRQRMDELKTAFERFVESEEEMRFLHTYTVSDTKQRLADLIAACHAYSDNLGWYV